MLGAPLGIEGSWKDAGGGDTGAEAAGTATGAALCGVDVWGAAAALISSKLRCAGSTGCATGVLLRADCWLRS